jgi:hypothetical protein
MSIIFKLTTAGRAALVAAAHDGTAARTVVSVGLTATAFVFDAAMAVLPAEIKRVTTISGGAAAADTIHLGVRDDSSDAYTVKGFGLYLDNGVLLGTYSQADPIIIKAAQSIMLLAIDARVLDGSVDISTLIFGDTNFLNPPATENVQGVVELATDDEVGTGVDDARAVTPKKLKNKLINLILAHEMEADPHPQYVRCLTSGVALPTANEGVIWHDDYNSLMRWQVFNQNGANYTGYASIYVGRVELDAQPTARAGKVKTGFSNLNKVTRASLWNWALHNGLVVPLGSWTQGMNAYADNGDGTFRGPDLRAETLRLYDDGRGVDVGRAFLDWQAGQMPWHTHAYTRFASTQPQSGEDTWCWTGTFGDQTGGAGGTSNGSENRMRNAAQLGTIQI